MKQARHSLPNLQLFGQSFISVIALLLVMCEPVLSQKKADSTCVCYGNLSAKPGLQRENDCPKGDNGPGACVAKKCLMPENDPYCNFGKPIDTDTADASIGSNDLDLIASLSGEIPEEFSSDPEVAAALGGAASSGMMSKENCLRFRKYHCGWNQQEDPTPTATPTPSPTPAPTPTATPTPSPTPAPTPLPQSCSKFKCPARGLIFHRCPSHVGASESCRDYWCGYRKGGKAYWAQCKKR